MSDATYAIGTLLKRGDGAGSEAFTAVAEITSIGGPETSLDTAEVTNHQSTGGWEEHIGTVLRSGEITLEGNLLPDNTTQTNLRTDMTNRTKRNFQLLFPDVGATLVSFAGLVTKFGTSAAVDDKLPVSISIKITGPVTWS